MPLAPPAHRSEIDMINIRMAVVSRAQTLDEIQMSRQHDGVIQYGHL